MNDFHKEIYYEIKYNFILEWGPFFSMSRHVGYGIAMDFVVQEKASCNNRTYNQGERLEVIF